MGGRRESVRLVSRARAGRVLLAVLAVAVTTLVIFPLREVAPEVSPGVVYLLAVLLVRCPSQPCPSAATLRDARRRRAIS
jgi:hypothetical protein